MNELKIDPPIFPPDFDSPNEFLRSVQQLQYLLSHSRNMYERYKFNKEIGKVKASDRKKLATKYWEIMNFMESQIHTLHAMSITMQPELRDTISIDWKDLEKPAKRRE